MISVPISSVLILVRTSNCILNQDCIMFTMNSQKLVKS